MYSQKFSLDQMDYLIHNVSGNFQLAEDVVNPMVLDDDGNCVVMCKKGETVTEEILIHLDFVGYETVNVCFNSGSGE